MIINGEISRIVYRNADNGYCVTQIISDKGKHVFTAVGVMPQVSEGMPVEVEGEFTVNKKFGEQFAVSKVKICLPTDLESMVKYLASGLFKGIGAVTADLIVEKFGTDTFDVIANHPERLHSIRGLGNKRAMELHENFVMMTGMQEVILYLQDLEISLNMAINIYKVFGKLTKSVIESNPYSLIEDVDGIGFHTADKIAANIGIENESLFRISAGVVYILKSVSTSSGHTYLPKATLLSDVARLLTIDIESYSDMIESSILRLEIQGKVICLEVDGESIVMFYKHYEMEQKIASKIIDLIRNTGTILNNIDSDIKEYESINNIVLHDNQSKAVERAVSCGINVITGGPGTGKTTIVKAIISIFKKLGLKVQLCAPTGRAAKRLSESCGEEAKTIHRLLDLDFKNGRGFFTFNEMTKLECDVVIVDEVSMCDEYVFSSLLSAIPVGGRLIMVGDKDQLPSVGAGNVLSDMIMSGVIEVSYLTQIYRQSDTSLIISNAHRINQGEMPILRNKDSDFLFSMKDTPEEIANEIVEMVTDRIPKFMSVKPSDIQVLCPMKKGVNGVFNINKLLQESINPPQHDKGELKYGDTLFRLGDRVIHIQNNYDIIWEKDGEEGVGVFNGDIGIITDVSPKDANLTVLFEDGRLAIYSLENIKELLLAYAISVHKSQGSEFDIVILSLMKGSPTILTRNLLYTAVTRAKKLSVMVGDKDSLSRMVRNNYTARRYTLLTSFIVREAANYGLL